MSDQQQPEGGSARTGPKKPRRSRPSKREATGKVPQTTKTTTKDKKTMSLTALSEGMPGLTPALGQMLAQAAAVCLESRNHQTGVRLQRAGLMVEDLHVEWQLVDDQHRRSYADMPETTEWGACGIAILVVKEVIGKVVIERSIKGTGCDYWLGDNDYDGLPFEGKSRLEVAGILTGTNSKIESTIKQKKNQMKPSDHLGPGYVAVVEFGTPIACLETK
jgi:hypothetical protein